MLNISLADDHLYGKSLFTWLSPGDVYDGVFLCCSFPREISGMRSES